MIVTIILSFLSGACGANAFPHFVRGITKETYPTVFGYSPVVNFIVGWAGFVMTTILVYLANMEQYPLLVFIFIALGVLLMGIFHAWHGSIGNEPKIHDQNPN